MPDREKLIGRFAERLKEAYPQNDRNNPSPAIYYDDFCDIVDEVATEITDGIAHGVTVQERLVAKQVVTNKKYGSIRCPSCNAVLGASSHYCWQCGQKVTHKLPQPPKGE